MKLTEQKLLAIDPSLTATGWALFSVHDSNLLGVGVIFPPGPENLLATRLSRLQTWIEGLFDQLTLGDRDILICEGPAPLVDNPQSALKVEHVRGIFETLARARGISVPGRLNPRTVQSELLGLRGKQMARPFVKAHAREVAEKLYGERLGSFARVKNGKRQKIPQDIIDAVLIGTLALSRLQLAGHTGVSLEEAFVVRHDASKRSRPARGGRNWNEADLLRIRKQG